MAIKIIVAGFLFSCVLASFVLLTRDDHKKKVLELEGSNDPRVSFEDFTVYKYKGHKAEATMSGKIALFVDPNILEVYGSVRALRHNTEKREYVSSEAATIFFNTSGIAQLMESQPELTEAELEDNVNIGMKFNRLQTEFAEFLPKEKLFQSELPVELKGPTGDFKGRNGFKYFVDQELIKISGPIEGEMQGAAFETKKD